MVTSLILTVLIILIIDGVKLLTESLTKYHNRQFTSNAEQVSVVIACHNEEKMILGTLENLIKIFPEENIIVIDDGSTDKTADVIRGSGLNVQLIELGYNVGKVWAMKAALEKVKTPYTLLLDADVKVSPNFLPPNSLLDTYTAVAFNIMPSREKWDDSWWKRLLNSLQTYEYAKSMQIGRKAQDAVASVHCVSGAAGFFRTERLKNLSTYHTGIFPGEDLERTLIELLAEGQVIFADDLIETETPKTLRELIKQRIFGWWPGLYRNLPLFFALLFKKKVRFGLRVEMAYQIFSLFTDPLKIFSLFLAITTNQWLILLLVYLVYLILETIVFAKMNNVLLHNPLPIMAIYPFYNLMQMFLRMLALGVFLWKKIKKQWKNVAKTNKIIMTSLVLFFLLLAPNALANTNGTIQLKFQHVRDSNGRTIQNPNLFLDFRKIVYLETDLGRQMERLNVGGYILFKKIGFVVNPDLRIRRYDLMPKLTLEKTIYGPLVGRGSFGYSIGFMEKSFPVFGLGFDIYYGDYHRCSFDFIKEFGRKKGMTFIGKNHLEQHDYGIWWDVAMSITNFGEPGTFTMIGYKWFFIEASYYYHYDFNKFNRLFVGGGIKLNY